MKVLVIYSTGSGVSRRCAEMLCERIKDCSDIKLCDINAEEPPSPEGFDVAVIGGSIRMNKLNKKLKAYMRLHAEVLGTIHTAAFICCGYTESVDDYIHYQIPRELIPSLGVHYFGGELKPEKLKGFDKLVVKAVRSSILEADFECYDAQKSTLPEILPEAIWRLGDRIRGLR